MPQLDILLALLLCRKVASPCSVGQEIQMFCASVLLIPLLRDSRKFDLISDVEVETLAPAAI